MEEKQNKCKKYKQLSGASVQCAHQLESLKSLISQTHLIQHFCIYNSIFMVYIEHFIYSMF